MNSAAGQQELELALLGSLRTLPVPPDAKGLVWNALGVHVIGTGVTAVAGSSSWGAAFWRGTLKVLVTSKAAVAVPVVMAALGAGALHYHHGATEKNTVPDHAPNQQASSSSLAVRSPDSPDSPDLPNSPGSADSNADPSTPEAASDGASEAVLPEPPSRAPPLLTAKDHLREESALLERARALLRGGHPLAAQSTLLRLQAKFPKGALTQEREVLLIEALAARGHSDAAARDARGFVASHPESPHVAQLRRFIVQ